DRAFSEHSLLKVRLAAKLDMVDKIMIFRRGEWVMTERVPTWFGLRRKTVEFPGYAKVLVYATIKEAEHFAGTDVDRLPFRPGSMIIKLFRTCPGTTWRWCCRTSRSRCCASTRCSSACLRSSPASR